MTIRDARPASVMALLTAVMISAAITGCKPAQNPPPAPPPDKSKPAVAAPATGAPPALAKNWQAGRDPFAQPSNMVEQATGKTAQAGQPGNTNWVNGRDPFDDPRNHEQELPKLVVETISATGAKPHAVINGQTVRMGEFVAGARVETIARDSVTIQYKSLRKVLEMKVEWPALQLTGLMSEASGKPAAMINGQRVVAEDKVAGARVAAIDLEAGKVVMELRGQERTLEWRAKTPELRLQGIAFRTANPSALINGQTVFVGDKIEGVLVKAIQTRTVTLEFKGRELQLSLDAK